MIIILFYKYYDNESHEYNIINFINIMIFFFI